MTPLFHLENIVRTYPDPASSDPHAVRTVLNLSELDIRAGEILVTSGLDDAFPKGLPVARVLSATPSDLSPFQSIQAAPLAALSDLEELLLISRVEGSSVSGSLSGVLEAPRSPSSDSAGSPASRALRFPVRPVPTRRFS